MCDAPLQGIARAGYVCYNAGNPGSFVLLIGVGKTMDARPTIQTTEQGILLPRQLLDALGEVEIVQRDNYILIKPKNMTLQFKGYIHPRVSVESLHEDYESSLLQGADL
jgi:hypothetical protein